MQSSRPGLTVGALAHASLRQVRSAASGNTGLLVIASLVLIAVFAFILRDTAFLTSENFLNIVRQTTMVSIMAIAAVFVLSAGEIDLSFGATVALSALVGAVLIRDVGVLAGVAGAIGVGALVGVVNGAVAVRLGIPSFIVTLGMLGVVTGLARSVTNLASVPVTDESFNFLFGSGAVGPVPILLFWTAGALVLGHLVLRHTAFGRRVLATGGNEVAARYSGIPTMRIKFTVLVVSGVAAAVAGLLYTGRLHGARYTLGDGDLLTVLSAVIIGGTALAGGRGSVVGAVVGSLLMGTINNALIIMGLSVPQQEIFRGLIIVAAVALSGQRLSWRRWRSRG